MNHDMNTTRHPPPIRPEPAFSGKTISDLSIIATQSRHRGRFRFMCRSCAISDLSRFKHEEITSCALLKSLRLRHNSLVHARNSAALLCAAHVQERINRDIIGTFPRHSRKWLRFAKSLSCNCITHFFESLHVSNRTVSGHLRDIFENQPKDLNHG